jgi:hypothetical protein
LGFRSEGAATPLARPSRMTVWMVGLAATAAVPDSMDRIPIVSPFS